MLFYSYTEAKGKDEHETAKELLFSLVKEHIPSLYGISLCHECSGIPYLSQNGKKIHDIYVSLSHSHSLCAAAVSDKPVGIDVELVRGIKNESKIASRFLTEIDFPFDAEKTDYPFFYKWTYYEACFKATQRKDVSHFIFEHKSIGSKKGEKFVLCVVG